MSTLSKIKTSQRLTIEDIGRQVEEIQRAVHDEDFELAHILEDELAWVIIGRLASRGSRIAAAAMKARTIIYPRNCS